MKLEFPARGYRRTPGNGLTYRSKCGRFIVYKSDQVAGVRIRPPRWLAIEVTIGGGQRIISRHKKRETAEAACNRAANRGDSTTSRARPATPPKQRKRPAR